MSVVTLQKLSVRLPERTERRPNNGALPETGVIIKQGHLHPRTGSGLTNAPGDRRDCRFFEAPAAFIGQPDRIQGMWYAGQLRAHLGALELLPGGTRLTDVASSATET